MYGKWFVCLVIAFLVGSANGHAPFASEVLTDAQKKQIIYRMYEDYKEAFPEVEDIMPQEALALMKSAKVVFVDSRKAKERKISILPGAISEKAFKKNLEKYKNYIAIGYCTISYRSGKLARKLRNKGIKMLNLKGGLLAWIHEGGKIYDEKGETKRVHVYSKKWNYVPEGYEAIW